MKKPGSILLHPVPESGTVAARSASTQRRTAVGQTINRKDVKHTKSPGEQAGEILHMETMLAALTSLNKGDFSVRLPVTSDGTDGKVAVAFNQLVELLSGATPDSNHGGVPLNLATPIGALEQRLKSLIEVNRELETFSYSISHDLRAPLRSMSGFAQALMDAEEGKLGAEGLDYARRIASSAKRMDALLQDLLEYSRVARVSIPPESVDLDVVVAEIISLRERDVREKQACIEVKSSLGVVRAHLPTVQQILANLIDNALKFVEPGKAPHLHIWTEEPKTGPATGANGDNSSGRPFRRIWIEDNGIGIAREYHKKIFGLFERLHPSGLFPGTGLGLAIVRKAAQRMGGRVGLESEPGQGSRFWIELPSASAEEH